MLVTGTQDTLLWVCPELHKFVCHPENKDKKLAEILKMEELIIPRNSIFV